jgi:gas vesicle protein
MEVSSLQIGFDSLIALLVSVIGALGVWHGLKGKVTIQQMTLEGLNKDLIDLKTDKKDNLKLLHKRIDDLKTQVERNREKNDKALADLKSEMQAMEIRIINAINNK